MHIWFAVLLNDGERFNNNNNIKNSLVQAFPFHCSFPGVASSPAPWEGHPGDHTIIFERGNHCHRAKPDIF